MKHRPSAYRFQWYVKSTRRSATVAILLAVFISLSSDTCGAQQAPPKLVLHRTVTFADRQTYIELPFEVPEGVTRVTIQSSYTGRDKNTTIAF